MKRAVEEEMTEQEIANELGISRGRVSQLLKSALRKVRARALLLGLGVLSISGVAVAGGARLWVEHVYHVSCNGSSQTLVAENANRSGLEIMTITTAGVNDTNAVVFTTSTSGHVVQTARNGANLNGTAIPGGGSYRWPDSASMTQGVYTGAVTVICTSPDGVQAREW